MAEVFDFLKNLAQAREVMQKARIRKEASGSDRHQSPSRIMGQEKRNEGYRRRKLKDFKDALNQYETTHDVEVTRSLRSGIANVYAHRGDNSTAMAEWLLHAHELEDRGLTELLPKEKEEK